MSMDYTAHPKLKSTISLSLLATALWSGCAEDEPIRPPKPKPDMNQMNIPDMDETPKDEEMGEAPDQEMICQANADCPSGNYCDEGQCKPGECAEAQRNACGGCKPLEQEVGAPCGSCQKDQLACAADGDSLECNGDTPCSTPTVNTAQVANITQFSASLAGELVSIGDSPVQQRGFCLSQAPSPARDQAESECSELGGADAPGAFEQELDQLTLGTVYYVRAFATNAQGTAYGQEREFRTEDALLPQVQTLKLERGEDGEIKVSAQLDELGIPAHEGHGACLGAMPSPAPGDGASNCQDLGVAQATGPFNVEYKGLSLGQTYYVRAFARSSAGISYGQELTITLRPKAPTLKEVNADVQKITIEWEPVEGATSYRVYRDGALISAQPVAGVSFEDTTADAGPAPTNVGLALTASSDDRRQVRLDWRAPRVEPGTSHTYTISAVNDGGESDQSNGEAGARAAQPVTSYEVSIGGGSWIPVTGRTYADTSAPVGTITQANVTASQGTSSAQVNLSLQGGVAQPGAQVNYKVRALNAAGAGQESDPVQGNRAAASLSYQWQRSSGTSDANYADLSGATGTLHADRTAPQDGQVRFYRMVITGGAQPITTAGVSGYRNIGLPELSTLNPSNITKTSASFNGRIVSLGTTAISQHGYCVSESSQPVYVPSGANPTCVTFGARATTGAITTANYTRLSEGKQYHVRAFAVVSRNGTPFVAYGEDKTFETIPAKPTRPGIVKGVEYVRLLWTSVPHVSSYEVYRNGVKIATVPANQINFFDDDSANTAPPKPGLVPNVTSVSYCNGATIKWSAATQPSAGPTFSYTIKALNSAGASDPSDVAQGNRLAAPILGYKVQNRKTGKIIQTSASGREAGFTDISTPTITTGTITASISDPFHPTYIKLDNVGARKSNPPVDTVDVWTFNASGDGPKTSVNTSRSNCDLIIQWQRSDSQAGPFTDLAGLRGASADDYSAPASGDVRFYRAKVFARGSDDDAKYTNVHAGRRYSEAPVVRTASGAPNTSKTSISVYYVVDDYGIPVMLTSQHGVCISTSIDPSPGAANSTCTSACSRVSTSNAFNCVFQGLSRDTRYFARAWGQNAKTSPGYVYGANQEYRTAP